jgi:hypothetical protein
MDPQETGNPETSTQTGEENWRDAVPEDYRRVAEKFTSPADVVKSYAELERKLGRAVNLPGKDANEDEREAFYERLGRPPSANDYDIDLPDELAEAIHADEGARAQLDSFLGHAHKAGLTNEQAQAAVEWYLANLGDTSLSQQQRMETNHATLEADLRREWGADYDSNIEYGRRALMAFGDPETLDRLEDVVGAPSVVRMMARIGRRMGEAGDVGRGGTSRRDSLQEEMRKLQKSEDYWSNEETQRRVRALAVELFGTGQVVGSSPDHNL